jgi:hypothetical protein
MKTEPGFGALILTHGRAENVKTTKSLRKAGYTGPLKYLIDDEDTQAERYFEVFGQENVIVFNKAAIADTFDEGDNFDGRRSTSYARNAAFRVARGLGWTHFVMLDDDYTNWRWTFNSAHQYDTKPLNRLDEIFAALVRFLESTPTLSIALAQDGDMLGGEKGKDSSTINLGPRGKRKAMNTFVCATDRPIAFVSRMNEDVNTYLYLGALGSLFFTANFARITQVATQLASGGMSDLYLSAGTYVKSFYSVMYAPSCAVVHPMLSNHSRLHHKIRWRNAVPKILRETVRKGASSRSAS